MEKVGGVFEGTVAHFCMLIFGRDHRELEDVLVQVIDVTDVGDPTCGESFWIENSRYSTSLRLNIIELWLHVEQVMLIL